MKHTEEMQKITVHLPVSLVNKAMANNDKSMSETIREALRQYNHGRACDELRKLKGKVKFQYTWQELRTMDDNA